MNANETLRISHLEWFLTEGVSLFFKSPTGHLLVNLKNRAYDSTGADIRKQYLDPAYDSWTHMKVNDDNTKEPSYTIDETRLLKFAKVGRWVKAVRETDPQAMSMLEVYHGDAGFRFASQFDDGRILSVYHMTPTGRKWVNAMRARSDLTLNDAARLANEKSAQKQTPNDLRAARFNRIDKEAREMLQRAQRLYLEVSRVDRDRTKSV